MIKKITLATIFILLLFVNPLKFEGAKICSNIPYVEFQCIGYSNAPNITMEELGD